MGQSQRKSGRDDDKPPGIPLEEMIDRFEKYATLDLKAPSVFLGLPSVLWSSLVLPWALAYDDERACAACGTTGVIDTYFSLRLVCKGFYGLLRCQTVWKRVFAIQFDENTIAAWTACYNVSSKPLKSFADDYGLESSFNRGEPKENLHRTLGYVQKDEDKERCKLNWQFSHARRVALQKWWESLCLEEQMWLMLILRVPCVSRLRLANAEKGPFSVGDVIELDIAVTPSRINTACSVKNGDIGKFCGPLPEDDWLTEGYAISTFDGDSIQHGNRSPTFFGHGCVSAYTDSLQHIGTVRRVAPCCLNADPKHVTCPVETVFRTEGRLLYQGQRVERGNSRPFFETTPQEGGLLVILFKNWILPVDNGIVSVIARYCSCWYTGSDNCRRVDCEKVLRNAYHKIGDPTLENGEKCTVPLGSKFYTNSILSNVIQIPIASTVQQCAGESVLQ